MRLLDLFCGAGGAAMGYHRAGFDEIVGVDNRPQKNYPFAFVQGDALEYLAAHGHEFDAIHASPPCQRWSESTPIAARERHPDLIDKTRGLIPERAAYVIENVDGARRLLRDRFYLCGTMFGLNVHRHRRFEWALPQPLVYSCRHNGHPVMISGSAHGRGEAKVPEMIAALDVPWMKVRAEVRQAIPPAYTEWIGRRLMEALR